MFAAVLVLTAAAALPGAYVVEHARTEQLVVVPGAAGPEALLVVDDKQAQSSELRAVRIDPGQRLWTTARVLFTGAIGSFAVDVDAGIVLVAVVGAAPGVVLVPLRPASAGGGRGFVAVPGVRDVIVCGGRRLATAFLDGTSSVHDLTGVAPGARLDRPPAPTSSSPAAILGPHPGAPVTLSCNETTLTAASARELIVFDGPAPTRVPWPREDGDWIRAVLAVPGGDLVVWSQEALQVVDRRGARKAALGARQGSVQVVQSARGLRLLTNDASWSLPQLDDRRSLDGVAAVVAAVDDTRAVGLTRNGLRRRTLQATSTTTTLLDEPRSIARRPDGKRFAIGEKGGAVVVFDRPRPGDDWRPAATFHEHEGEVSGLAYLSAAVAGTPGDALVTVGGDGFVHVYAEPRLTRVRSIRLGLQAESVAFDVARGRVAVVGIEALAVVDIKAGTVQRLGPLPRENFGSLKAGAFSPDGTQLAFVDDVGRVRVYALADGREDRRIAGAHGLVTYDRRGRLVRATRDEVIIDGRATRVDIDADHATLDTATGELWLSSWSGAFGPLGREPRQAPWHIAGLVLDGERVITIGPDEQVSSWPRRGAGTRRAVFGVPQARVEAVAFVGDDVAVAFEADRIRIASRDGRTRALRPARCGDVDLTPAQLVVRTSADARTPPLLVGATRLGEVSWNMMTGAMTCPPDRGLDDVATSVAGFTSDGRAVLLGAAADMVVVGADKHTLQRAGSEDVDIDAAIVTGDGPQRMVVYADAEGVHAVRVVDGVEVARTHEGDIAALPGGRVLLGRWGDRGDGGDERLAIAVWHPGAGPPRVLTRAHSWTNHLRASPDGNHFVHAVDGELYVRSVETGAVRAVIEDDHVEAIAFSPDSTRFVVARARALSVYDLDGTLLWSMDPRPH